jgi:formate dehydrogenase subunit delta
VNSVERLVYMANQIAKNLETDDDPVSATANHIQLFWDPRMKRLIREHGTEGLSPIASAALGQLAGTHDAA